MNWDKGKEIYVHLAAAFCDPVYHPYKVPGDSLRPPAAWETYMENVMVHFFENDIEKAGACMMQYTKYINGEDYGILAWTAASLQMAPGDWHRRFSTRHPEWCMFAAALCDGHSASGIVERSHKTYGLVHSPLRNGLNEERSAHLVHCHNGLRLKVDIGKVGWRMKLLDWAQAKDLQEQRKKRRELAGVEVDLGSYDDIMSTTYGLATSRGAPAAGI